MGRDSHLPGLVADAAIVAATLVIIFSVTLTQEGSGASSPQAVALTLVAAGSLAFRRRHPVLVMIITLVAFTAYSAFTEADGPVFITFIVALYTAAAEGQLAAAVIMATISTLGMIAKQATSEPGTADSADQNAVFIIGWLLAVLAVGGVTWNRRAYLAEVEQRALEAERTRDAEGRRRVTDERLRIARELHDVLAHNISVINVQAGAALYQLTERPRPDRPGEVVAALTAIRDAGRDAGRELRATLGVLREGNGETPTAPAPGLARLPDLVETAGQAGLSVRTVLEGTSQRIPAEVDLAAFRIVQEALTNVVRHADAKAASVLIRYGDDDVLVQVDDEGTMNGAHHPPGLGIRGMCERAHALGGEVRTGPRAEGGFQVRARLPLKENA